MDAEDKAAVGGESPELGGSGGEGARSLLPMYLRRERSAEGASSHREDGEKTRRGGCECWLSADDMFCG